MACIITADFLQKLRKDARQTVEARQSTTASNAKCTSAIVLKSFVILHFTLTSSSIISDEYILVYLAKGSIIIRQIIYFFIF